VRRSGDFVEGLALLGIAALHARPFHPQTCGKIERFHQTLKRWLRTQPRARTLAELQAQLDWFTSSTTTAARTGRCAAPPRPRPGRPAPPPDRPSSRSSRPARPGSGSPATPSPRVG
jgi:hypothetical protein